MTDSLINLHAASVTSVMSRPLLTVAAGDSAATAHELATQANIHHLPVMATDGQCLGMVDTRALEIATRTASGQVVVREIMGAKPPGVTSSASIADVASAMDEHDVDAVIVVADGELVGLVTWRDVLRFVAA